MGCNLNTHPSGNFLLNNYKQALKIIKEYGPEVEAFKTQLAISDTTFEEWLNNEREFLLALKDEPDEWGLKCSYVEALIAKKKARYVL
jgi:hypothetical protein